MVRNELFQVGIFAAAAPTQLLHYNAGNVELKVSKRGKWRELAASSTPLTSSPKLSFRAFNFVRCFRLEFVSLKAERLKPKFLQF